MKHIWKTRGSILGLIVLGVVLTGYRASERRSRPVPPWESVWKLQLKVELQKTEKAQKLRLQTPRNSRSIRIYRESLSHPGFRVETISPPQRPKEWVARPLGQGPATLNVEFDLHVSPERNFPDRRGRSGLSPDERSRYLRSTAKLPASKIASLKQLKNMLSSKKLTKAEVLENIFTHCHKVLHADDKSGEASVLKVLEGARGSPLGIVRTMVTLCRSVKIPSRIVTGFEIKSGSRPPLIHWAQVNLGKGWINYDPVGGFSKELPAHYFMARRDGEEVFQRVGISEDQAKIDYGIQRANMPDELTGAREARWTDIFELTRLPLNLQKVLALLLLLPFGALVTAFFRNIVGLVTFGTFGPTLLALAFLYSDWQSGLVIAIAILIVGLFLRYALEPLRLLMIPRLGVILTGVVFCMITGISILDYLGLSGEGQAVLLPMVILTGLIERLFITVEEDGAKHTFKRLGGTLLVGFCCYLVLSSKSLGRFLLIYPEVHFGTVAVMVWMGRYSGYRLSELLRFRDLAESIPEASKAESEVARSEPVKDAAEAEKASAEQSEGEEKEDQSAADQAGEDKA